MTACGSRSGANAPSPWNIPFPGRRAASSASYTTCSGKSSSPRACSSEESAVMVKKIDDMNFYELLEISPAAGTQDVHRAYDRVRRIYDPNSIALYSLFTPEETARIRQRIEDA